MNKVLRLICTLKGIKYLFSKFFILPFKLRRMYYIQFNRLFFWLCDVKFGKNMQVINHFHLKKSWEAEVTIGDNFVFTSGESINPLCRNQRGCIFAPKGAIVRIGNNVGISSACIWAKERIEIDDNVKIGGDCILMDTDAHNLDYKIRNSMEKDIEGNSLDNMTAASAPIHIEHDVLIGTRCIILKGVTIGARSVIGSGSVVTKSIPSDCIAAGNPCRVIKYL